MARRRNLLDEIADLPWWFGLTVAGLVYVFLKYGLLAMTPPSPTGQSIARAISNNAWLVALFFVGPALVSAVRQLARGRLFDAQINLESIRGLAWQDFEHLVAEAFSRQGYFVEERGGSAPDGGVDLELWKGGKKSLVQCKRWQTKLIGVNLVRELYGVMTAAQAEEAVFVSSGDYTDDAREFANGKPIRLINGKTLLKMIRAAQQTVPQPTAEESIPMCPNCARPMVMRRARSARGAGQDFWGCSAFPQCRGTRSLS